MHYATQTELAHSIRVVCAFGILAALLFFERWTGAFRSDLVFKHTRLHSDFNVGMLY